MTYVLVRETLDWSAAKLEDVNEGVRPIAKVWDTTFKLSFTQCRAVIKDVAQARLRRLVGDRLLTVPAPPLTLGESDILLICDDDDWYAPDVSEQLLRCGAADGMMAIWPDALFGCYTPYPNQQAPVEPYLGPLRLRLLNATNVVGPVKTNNYAVMGRFFSGRPLSEAVGPVLTHHTASHTLGPMFTNKKPGVVESAAILSVCNRTPCSTIVLWRATLGGIESEALRALVRQFVSSMAPERFQPELEWAIEPAQAMVELFRQALGE